MVDERLQNDENGNRPFTRAEIRDLRQLLEDLRHFSWLWRLTKIWVTTIAAIVGGTWALIEVVGRYMRLK